MKAIAQIEIEFDVDPIFTEKEPDMRLKIESIIEPAIKAALGTIDSKLNPDQIGWSVDIQAFCPECDSPLE